MRKIRIASTIQDEMEQRWLGLPWYLDRLEFSYAGCGALIVFLCLWIVLPSFLAIAAGALTLPLWMWMLNKWKSGKEPGYRWDSLYRWGLTTGKSGWIPRKRKEVRVTPYRLISKSSFANTGKAGLPPRDAVQVLVPNTASIKSENANEFAYILEPQRMFLQRKKRVIVRKSRPAPVWFGDLMEAPEGRDESWLTRPTIDLAVEYEDLPYATE